MACRIHQTLRRLEGEVDAILVFGQNLIREHQNKQLLAAHHSVLEAGIQQCQAWRESWWEVPPQPRQVTFHPLEALRYHAHTAKTVHRIQVWFSKFRDIQHFCNPTTLDDEATQAALLHSISSLYETEKVSTEILVNGQRRAPPMVRSLQDLTSNLRQQRNDICHRFNVPWTPYDPQEAFHPEVSFRWLQNNLQQLVKAVEEQLQGAVYDAVEFIKGTMYTKIHEQMAMRQQCTCDLAVAKCTCWGRKQVTAVTSSSHTSRRDLVVAPNTMSDDKFPPLGRKVSKSDSDSESTCSSIFDRASFPQSSVTDSDSDSANERAVRKAPSTTKPHHSINNIANGEVLITCFNDHHHNKDENPIFWTKIEKLLFTNPASQKVNAGSEDEFPEFDPPSPQMRSKVSAVELSAFLGSGFRLVLETRVNPRELSVMLKAGIVVGWQGTPNGPARLLWPGRVRGG